MSLTPEQRPFVASAFSAAPLHSEDFYHALTDAVDVGLLAINNSGMTIHANRIARESFNISCGTHLNSIMPELWDKISQTLRERKPRLEISVRGVESNYLVKVSPIMVDSERVGVACLFIESTELEDIAMQMRFFQELTSELDTIIDSSSDGLWICDAEANVLRINPASERVNKIQAREVVGRNMRELVQEGFVDRSVTLEVIKTGTVFNMLQQREGSKLILTGNPVFNTDGDLIRVVVSERDVTEIDTLQRELEEQGAIKDQMLHHMLEMQQLELESRRVIAKSPCMLKALRQALKVSVVDSSVLILGESGVGKGLFADLIHKNSRRADKPLIKINCGAIPESLIESELFGYEKGAFTGAQTSGKPGYLELADGGTLFLDEIAELPTASQVKLLRFLEDGRVTRLGGTKSRTVNVRILAATNRNLEEMVKQERFRLDLYYRLKVIPIHVPSVRERKECVLPMVHHYIDIYGEKNGIKKRLSGAVSDALSTYHYPGNVRELINICERLVVMSETEVIDLQDLPGEIIGHAKEVSTSLASWPETMTLQQAIESVERSILAQALERYANQSQVADVLGVNQSTISKKLKRYGLG
ncbi:MAG: sigma 54-interacting transcriptional regulator [Desulfuromonadaceae bacterium]